MTPLEETALEKNESFSLRSGDNAKVDELCSRLQEKELAFQKQSEQLHAVAKKFAGLKKKFSGQKEHLKELEDSNKKLDAEKAELLISLDDMKKNLLEFQEISKRAEEQDSMVELLKSEISRFHGTIVTTEEENNRLKTSLESRDKEVSLLHGQLNTASERLEVLENVIEERDKYVELLSSKDNELDLLKAELQKSEASILKKNDEISAVRHSAKEDFSVHVEQLEILKNQVEVSCREISDLQESLRVKENEIKRLEDERESFVGQVENSSAKIFELDKMLKEREGEVEENAQEISFLQSQLDNKIREKTELSEDILRFMNENEQLKLTLESNQSQGEIENFSNEMTELQKAFQEKDILVTEYEKQFENLRNDMQDMELENRRLGEALDEIVEQKRSLEGLLQVRDVEVDDLRCKVSELECFYDTEKDALEKLQADKDEELQQLNDSLMMKSTLVDELSQKLSERENEHNLKEMEEKLMDTEQQLTRLQTDLQQLKENNTKLQENLCTTGNTLELSNAKNSSLEETIINHMNDINDLKEALRKTDDISTELRTKVEQLEELLSEKDAQLQTLQQKDNETESLKLVLTSKNQEILELQEKYDSLIQVKQDVSDKVTELGSIPSGKSELEKESLQSKEMATMNEKFWEEKNSSLQEKIAELEKERIQLRRKLATMKKANAEVGKQHKQLQSALSQQEIKLAEVSLEKQTIKEDLESAITLIQQEKSDIEAEFEDTVKELKELKRINEDICKERDSLKADVETLRTEKEWNSSELENLQSELDKKYVEIQELKIRQTEASNDFDVHVQKRVDEISMEKNLERAEIEEEFANQLQQMSVEKDEKIRKKDLEITELKNKLVEGSSLSENFQNELRKLNDEVEQQNKQIIELYATLESEKATVESKDVQISSISTDIKNLQNQLNSKDEELKASLITNNDTSVKIDELLLEVKALKDELNVLSEARDASDKMLHEVSSEKQLLNEQFQKALKERDELKKLEGDTGQMVVAMEEKDKVCFFCYFFFGVRLTSTVKLKCIVALLLFSPTIDTT